MSALRILCSLLLASALVVLVASCVTYRDASLASIEVGDEVRLVDAYGTPHVFEVTAIDGQRIAGDDVVVPIRDIRSLEAKHVSVRRFGKEIGRFTLGVLYVVVVTVPLWAFLLPWA